MMMIYMKRQDFTKRQRQLLLLITMDGCSRRLLSIKDSNQSMARFSTLLKSEERNYFSFLIQAKMIQKRLLNQREQLLENTDMARTSSLKSAENSEASQNMLYSLRRRMTWRRGLVKQRKLLIQLLSFHQDHPALTILLSIRKVRFNVIILLIMYKQMRRREGQLMKIQEHLFLNPNVLLQLLIQLLQIM